MRLSVATAIFLIASITLFSFSFKRTLDLFLAGAKENRFNEFLTRLGVLWGEVGLHRKMFRQFGPGLLHFLIFWGFIVLSLGTLEWVFMGLSGGLKFSFIGMPAYGIFLFSQDLFNSLVFLAVLYAFYRRIFVRPKRMADNSGKSKADAFIVLAWIWGLVISNLVTHAIEIHNIGVSAHPQYQPVAAALASFIPDLMSGETSYWAWWWLHLILIFSFLNFLPFSKHFHVLLAAPNVLLSKLEPTGRLSTPNLEDESILSFGADKLKDLKWKSMMDAFTCTECGRCNEYCPTATTGKDLRPKTLMIDLRAALTKNSKVIRAKEEATETTALVPAVFSDQFVWDCTTCGACVEQCPVMIDHVDVMVEMRRALVLNRGSNPDEATNVFRNWETNSNPWGLPESSRQEWLVEKGVPMFDGDGNFDFLYYIGCAGSFDERNKKVVESVIEIVKKAGLKIGILGKEEKCNGETARRMGNEWLAQQMMKTNIELLQGKKVKRVITSCPHCFNTLKNEYPVLGGVFEVIHHSELIDRLIRDKKIQPQSTFENVVYHDSCYIGRYNQIYDEPRRIVSAVSKDEPTELQRNRDKGFCCGAGGGRMWLEETTGSRINQNRADEIINSKAKTVGVACPFCMTMISDGLKSKEREDIQVKDLAEMVAESLR